MTLVNTLRRLVFSDQFLLREVVDYLDTTTLLVWSLSSKSFRHFASRREIWDVDTKAKHRNGGVCRWPWDDMEPRSLISYVNHRHLDAKVLSFVQSTSSQELMQLLSEPSSVHAIFLLHHLSTTSPLVTTWRTRYNSSPTNMINHLQMLGLSDAIPDVAAVVVASKALLFLKSKILQWKWDNILRTMTGHDLLFEGFQLIADAKSHISSVSLDGLVDMHGESSGQRDGMDCHRKVSQRTPSAYSPPPLPRSCYLCLL